MNSSEHLWVYPIGMLVAFLSACIKGFQHKNVIGGHLKTMTVTSYFVAAFDVLSVTMVVEGGLWMIPFVGTGGAVGMLVAFKFHERLFGSSSTKKKETNENKLEGQPQS